MEAVKMSRVPIIFVLSLLTLMMVKGGWSIMDETKDRHLCPQPVAVSYTEEVPMELEELGDFEKYFKQLGVPGGNKTVTKTRLEDELVCCPGYVKSDDGDCVSVQTTTESTTEESQFSTEVTSPISEIYQLSHDSNQQSKEDYLSYLLYAVLAIGVLVVLGASVCLFLNRKPKVENSVKFDAEGQDALIKL